MAYINNNGQVRIGVRSGITNSPIIQPAFSASLLQALYGVWNGDSEGTGLTSSLYGAWNGEGSNNKSVKNAWNANGNAIDSKSGANGTIVTPNSTTGYTTSSMTYSTGKLGTSAFTFNGSNFINLPSNTFSFTSDFTVGCWFYVPTNYVSNANLLSAFDNTGSYPTYFGWWLSYDSTNKKIGFSIGDSTQGSYGNVTLSTANNTITPGQWNHVMVTRKNGNRSRIYINGVLSNSNTNTVNPRYSNGYSSIGSAYFAFSNPFWKAANAGLKIDSVQTWESELDQAAITELYNSGNGQEYPFTISNVLIPSPVDSFGVNNGTLVNGTTFTTGKVGNAFSFDGVNDYVQLPNDTFKPIYNFAVSFWLKLNAINATQYLFTNCSAVNNGFRIVVGSNNKIYFEYNGNSFVGTTTLSTNTWYHVCVMNTGTTYEIYLNGTLDRTNVGQTIWSKINWGSTGTNIAYIGRYVTSAYYLNGSIDALTVWDKSLNIDEITQLYNSGTGTQYPFSGYLSSSANQFGVENGTLMNGCSFTTGKIGQAFTFDGVNDYVQLPDNSLNFTGDFTTSFWFYANAFTGQDSFVTCENWVSPNDNGWYIYHYQGNLAFSVYNGTNTTGWKTSTTITTGTWYHVVVVKNRSTSPKFYINGDLVSTVLRNGTDITLNPGYVTTQYCSLGTDRYSVSTAHAYLNGKMDGVNVWQREITQSEITELYNSGNGKQITTTPIIQTGLILNLDASRKSSYPNTGTTWYDISGSGNNGTLTNGPILATASDGVISFDGVNDFVKIPLNLSSYSQITVEIWYKINSGGSNLASWGGMLWEHSSDWNNNGGGFGLSVNSGGCSPDLSLMHTNHNGGSGPMNYQYNSGTTWSCHVNVFSTIVDPTGRLVYVNGQLVPFVSTNTCGGSWSTSTSTIASTAFRNDFLYISSRNGTGAFINGNIGLIRVYNRKLSASEIQQNFNASKSRFGL